MNPRKYCYRLPIIFVILYAGIIYNLLSWNLFRLMSQSIWKFLKRCWKHFKGYEQMHKQHYTALKLEDEFCIQQKEWNVNSFAIFWFCAFFIFITILILNNRPIAVFEWEQWISFTFLLYNGKNTLWLWPCINHTLYLFFWSLDQEPRFQNFHKA